MQTQVLEVSHNHSEYKHNFYSDLISVCYTHAGCWQAHTVAAFVQILTENTFVRILGPYMKKNCETFHIHNHVPLAANTGFTKM